MDAQEWHVAFTMPHVPSDTYRMDLQRWMDEHGVDGAVSAVPDDDQWTVSFGVGAEWHWQALHDAEDMMVKAVGHVPDNLIGVEAITLDELERRAETPTMPDLMGAAEIAEELGVRRQRVHQLATENPRFPAPLVRVAMGPLWDRRAIEKFEREWERRPGRPAKAAS